MFCEDWPFFPSCLTIMERKLFCNELGDGLNAMFCDVICIFPELRVHEFAQEMATEMPPAIFLKSSVCRKLRNVICCQ